jgi:5-formyltetrahydrofolate cyclo-ligase
MTEKNGAEPNDEVGTFASLPCYMHEIDPVYAGLIVDHRQERDEVRWGKAERQRLIAARLSVSIVEREACAASRIRAANHLSRAA